MKMSPRLRTERWQEQVPPGLGPGSLYTNLSGPPLSLPLEPLDATVGPGSGQSGPPACHPLPAVKMADEKKKKKNLIGKNHIPLVPGRPGLPGSPDVIKQNVSHDD